MARQTITRLLLSWYQHNKRDLPWRRSKDPYMIWVSEVMLQQTTVATVIPYYERWVKAFPTIADVAKARETKLLKMWQGLGYYNRVRNFHKAAKIVRSEYAGQLPDDPQTLKKLPGFGAYTTAAVLSIAFDQKLTLIDANVRRVAMRLLAIEGKGSSAIDERIHAFLLKLLPAKKAGDFNQALMELGALICRSKNPLCSLCPLKNDCRAYAKGIQEIIPAVKKKILTEIDVVVGIFKKDNKIFMQKRPANGLLAGMWEFPGGKIEKGETAPQALIRELKEELGILVKVGHVLAATKHFYTEFKVSLSAYGCEIQEGAIDSAQGRWLKSSDLTRYPMPSGTSKIIDLAYKKLFDKIG